MSSPKILLLTGPAAAGKNTIAHRYATTHENGADIDADLVSWMQRQPHHAPWDAPETETGYPQLLRTVRHVTMLAKSFADDGFQVVITHATLPNMIDVYRQQIAHYNFYVVKLMPTWEVSLGRLHEKGMPISEDEARQVYEWSQAVVADLTIDNSELSPEDVVDQLNTYLHSDT